MFPWRYIASLATLLGSFSELNCEIQRHVEHCKVLSGAGAAAMEERIALFRREFQRFELMLEYWRQFYAFEGYFKEIAKAEAQGD